MFGLACRAGDQWEDVWALLGEHHLHSLSGEPNKETHPTLAHDLAAVGHPAGIDAPLWSDPSTCRTLDEPGHVGLPWPVAVLTHATQLPSGENSAKNASE
jgi:hypothetical protein